MFKQLGRGVKSQIIQISLVSEMWDVWIERTVLLKVDYFSFVKVYMRRLVLLRKQSIVAPRSSFRLTNKSELRIFEAVRANASFSLVVFVKVVVLEVMHTHAIKSLENILVLHQCLTSQSKV